MFPQWKRLQMKLWLINKCLADKETPYPLFVLQINIFQTYELFYNIVLRNRIFYIIIISVMIF